MRRMDRYQDEAPTMERRSEKNRDLYQDIANNPKYTNITDVTNSNAFELGTRTDENKGSREAYQEMRKYKGVEEEVPRVKKELEDFNYLYPKKQKKIYDINSVLEEARKNRQEKDDLEEKRKLKYTSYNILAGVNIEELARYREEKKNRAATPEEEGIRELMDTIASKTLAGEISKEETVELLSDLMATNMMDKVVPADEIGGEDSSTEILETHTISIEETREEQHPEEKEEVEEKEDDEEEDEDGIDPELAAEEIRRLQERNEEEEEELAKKKEIDDSFYTKSMDLSENDFDEMSEEFQEKGLPLPVKILIALLIIAVLVVAGYFIYLRIK